MARFPVPEEARLETLLREAYEFMPGPDMNRLEEIEARLLRAARRPTRPPRAGLPWWAILLLIGGAATAAWWAGERFGERGVMSIPSGNDAPETAGEPLPGSPPARAEPGAIERTGETETTGDEKRIIYERETP